MLKVLVVEDDTIYIEELREEVFNKEQAVRCDVRYASNVEAAQKITRRFRPDFVLLDMVFPLQEGGKADSSAGAKVIDFLDKEHSSARVVALSSQDREFAVKLLTTRKIADFLFKDTDWTELAARVSGHLETTVQAKKVALASRAEAGTFICEDPQSRQLLQRIDQVAATESTVMILGESGTGKEVLARRIHDKSNRVDGPFIAVNCGALDEELVRSELFGHSKGAFTGATSDRAGKFEIAHGGTLFLDEVGELSLANQVRLLRVLEERVIERVGSSDPIECNVRLVAATNRPLEEMVKEGTFRKDLFFRLHVFAVNVPPLRSRKRDIPIIARHFVTTLAEKMGRAIEKIDDEAIVALQKYDWPGNVRQLRNVIEHAVILEGGPVLTASSFPPLVGMGQKPKVTSGFEPGRSYAEMMTTFEEQLLTEGLSHYRGDTNAMAKELGVNLRTLQRRIKALGVKSKDYK